MPSSITNQQVIAGFLSLRAKAEKSFSTRQARSPVLESRKNIAKLEAYLEPGYSLPSRFLSLQLPVSAGGRGEHMAANLAGSGWGRRRRASMQTVRGWLGQ